MYRPLTDVLFFEKDYRIIAEHLKKSTKEIRSITDIGCGFGAQNIYFQEYKYIGIDVNFPYGDNSKEFLLSPNEENITYYQAHFPEELTDEMIGDVFVANMSVGYEPEERIQEQTIIEGFSRFQKGYARLSTQMHTLLEQIFPFHEALERYEEPLKAKRKFIKLDYRPILMIYYHY